VGAIARVRRNAADSNFTSGLIRVTTPNARFRFAARAPGTLFASVRMGATEDQILGVLKFSENNIK
jgi:hypothetical protein